jgi:hypothetical protein
MGDKVGKKRKQLDRWTVFGFVYIVALLFHLLKDQLALPPFVDAMLIIFLVVGAIMLGVLQWLLV